MPKIPPRDSGQARNRTQASESLPLLREALCTGPARKSPGPESQPSCAPGSRSHPRRGDATHQSCVTSKRGGNRKQPLGSAPTPPINATAVCQAWLHGLAAPAESPVTPTRERGPALPPHTAAPTGHGLWEATAQGNGGAAQVAGRSVTPGGRRKPLANRDPERGGESSNLRGSLQPQPPREPSQNPRAALS